MKFLSNIKNMFNRNDDFDKDSVSMQAEEFKGVDLGRLALGGADLASPHARELIIKANLRGADLRCESMKGVTLYGLDENFDEVEESIAGGLTSTCDNKEK